MARLAVFLQASYMVLTLILASACSSSGSDETSGSSQQANELINDTTTASAPDAETEQNLPSTDPGETSTTPPWTPVVSPGSNLERLVSALQRQVSNTLLKLNQKISGGEALTQTETDCVGGHDPSLGQPLLAIECAGSPLAAAVNSATIRVSVPRASFFDTDACRTSLINARSDTCHLSSSQLFISNEWVVPPSPQLPYPVAGVQISYAIDTPVVILESLADALSDTFYCEIDLLTGLPGSGDCADAVPRVAKRLDNLVN